MSPNKIMIDFDGVIFDTEKRVVDMKKSCPNITWNEFFDKLDWFDLLQKANVINNSVRYILEAQSSGNQLAILTKVHTLMEMQAKTEIIRDCGISIPIFFVPPHVRKSAVCVPMPHDVLIDDSLKNLIDWKEHGGKGIYFNENLKSAPNFETIKTLKRVLR